MSNSERGSYPVCMDCEEESAVFNITLVPDDYEAEVRLCPACAREYPDKWSYVSGEIKRGEAGGTPS